MIRDEGPSDGEWRMADGEWRMDDLIRFLYAILGDAFAFLKLISINVLFACSASFAVKLSFSFASLALPRSSALPVIGVYLRSSAAEPKVRRQKSKGRNKPC